MDPAAPPHLDRIGSFARAVRLRRKRLRLTQIELSKLSGCGPDFIYDLEAGKTTLRLDKLLDVLAVLGLELVLAQGKQGLRISQELVAEPPKAKPPRARPAPKRR